MIILQGEDALLFGLEPKERDSLFYKKFCNVPEMAIDLPKPLTLTGYPKI
jgi:hypothetical protein